MLARIQVFSDAWQFFGGKTHQCRQIGNALPPLATAFGQSGGDMPALSERAGIADFLRRNIGKVVTIEQIHIKI